MSIARMNTFDINLATRLAARPRARHRVRRHPIGMILLGQAAWIGLALFLTSAFAVAVSLFTGRHALEPGPLQACSLVFVWCVILFGSAWNA
jgi:hypothetical protein